MFQWLLGSSKVELNKYDAESPEVNDYHYLPDTKSLSERMKSCLQEPEELPRDFTTLFDNTVFKLDTDLIPEAVNLYEVCAIEVS